MTNKGFDSKFKKVTKKYARYQNKTGRCNIEFNKQN